MIHREAHFHRFALSQLQPFAEHFPIQYIKGQRNCQLAYRHFVRDEETPRKLVILVNGRAENILKWTEIAYDFFLSGYDVLIFDHRGQGYSQRLLKDSEKGYVDEFRFYAEDMAKIIEKVTALYDYQQQHIVAHSLGALISSFYLANYDHHIKSAVFSAPFWGMPLKHPVRDQLVVALMNLLGKGSDYVFGKTAYQPANLDNNELSGCRTRMKWMNRVNRKFPAIHLGGPTFRWVHLCMNAIKQLPKILPRIEIPVLVLQSERERIVSNKNLTKLTALLPNGNIENIAQAKHEILFERDPIREQAMQRILAFFRQAD
ncbi:lysophospholipase [Pasteurella langaaensis DSM 22999]|uniref:Lysophospholipase n=1 Tax=Alitibacter langaaensis DSM 22999 TaxID=1122935 RepID=A0A2U0T6I8_9PAST|nr:lysophospholipase [Pasteurella langaaensis DSM 22999]